MPAPALDWLSARRRELSYPSPAIAWGGWTERSDGRVGALAQQEKSRIDDVFFENPHPGSLSLADPPRKGEGLTRVEERASNIALRRECTHLKRRLFTRDHRGDRVPRRGSGGEADMLVAEGEPQPVVTRRGPDHRQTVGQG